ncbi:hypothetical protein EGW08_018676 [Elysia chlorotica]|uniref:Uncharacterized protein n=1 Tax=Elysia chlorotica TaxID=188477 RepID=A0A3S1B2N4_ELYCH|nr:hypothetical protein EGW08_018676 [Elysia chlorotica]
MPKFSYPAVSSGVADVSSVKVSRRPFQGQSSTKKIMLFAALFALVVSPADAYFMKCKHFCSMLTKDELKQLWCIYDMCSNDKLGRHLLRYAKRGETHKDQHHDGQTSDVASPVFDPLLEGSYAAAAMRDLSHGRKQRFSIPPGSSLYRSITEATRGTFVDAAVPTQDKRDVEYWDGPAPAEINA